MLSSIFNDASRFQRVAKVEEFITVKKTPVEPLHEKKKRKRDRDEEDDEEKALDKALETRAVNLPSEDEKIDNTIFIGNVPMSLPLKKLTQYFKEFGEIESIRMRSVPSAGTAVDDAGNQDLVRKICVNTKKFGDQKGSYNAYIVYKDTSAVTASLAFNNRVIDGRHVRVDKAKPTLFDPKKSVFLGGLPHYADEEKLREHFAKVLPNGHEDIDSIRLIRDPETLIGKGIGYLLLKDRDAVLKALTLHQSEFRNREIRVSTCGKRTKRAESEKSGVAASGRTGDATSATSSSNTRAKRQKVEKISDAKKNALAATQRLKDKKFSPKSFIAKKGPKGGQAKAPAKKKQLGGVIKRAMKAAKQG